MSSEFAIQAENLSKIYHLYRRPSDRFRQFLFGHRRTYYQAFAALSNVSFSLAKGEVLGLIGRNGAGKSTLLQLICGTLQPSSGKLRVNGRVAALLELGAGFNPEFSGRENVYLNASILGLSKAEIDDRYEEIVAFADIGEFIHQPVKTYSSGMYVRLAFSVATSVDPDILVIDEALSVGDGAFARKSFDRIMQLRAKGATILFCSHSMYHIEAICNQAIWLEQGRIKMFGKPTEVTQYFSFALSQQNIQAPKDTSIFLSTALKGTAHIQAVRGVINQLIGKTLPIISGETSFKIEIDFISDPHLPTPTIGVTIDNEKGETITSFGSNYDQVPLHRDSNGNGSVSIFFETPPLLKGKYNVNIFLGCENLLHFYDTAPYAVTLDVSQTGYEIGFFKIPHQWILGNKYE